MKGKTKEGKTLQVETGFVSRGGNSVKTTKLLGLLCWALLAGFRTHSHFEPFVEGVGGPAEEQGRGSGCLSLRRPVVPPHSPGPFLRRRQKGSGEASILCLWRGGAG